MGTFIPHDTHGINHIKHNLEYGYQVMDLIGRKGERESSPCTNIQETLCIYIEFNIEMLTIQQ